MTNDYKVFEKRLNPKLSRCLQYKDQKEVVGIVIYSLTATSDIKWPLLNIFEHNVTKL
jgi:hypothetical protein